MTSPVDVDVLVKFAIRLSIIFVLIFILALITPRLAKLVESWIEKKRKNRESEEEEDYGVRSIYELPRRKRSSLKEDAYEDDYDLEEEDEEFDGEEYSLDNEPQPEPEEPEEDLTEDYAEELSDEQPEAPPQPEISQKPEEPVYLFSFHKLEEKPYDLTLWKVRYKRAIPIDIGEQDFSSIAFGSKLHPCAYVGPGEEDDDDAESFIGEPLIPFDSEDEDFFDDFSGEAEDGEDDGDTPWFMR
ncbi:MAG: hypothetical protein K6F80_03190 [Oscillospiraceae bacterium]|nr:hypothetical protein [Oscillospiraceae bacterium]